MFNIKTQLLILRLHTVYLEFVHFMPSAVTFMQADDICFSLLCLSAERTYQWSLLFLQLPSNCSR